MLDRGEGRVRQPKTGGAANASWDGSRGTAVTNLVGMTSWWAWRALYVKWVGQSVDCVRVSRPFAWSRLRAPKGSDSSVHLRRGEGRRGRWDAMG